MPLALKPTTSNRVMCPVLQFLADVDKPRARSILQMSTASGSDLLGARPGMRSSGALKLGGSRGYDAEGFGSSGFAGSGLFGVQKLNSCVESALGLHTYDEDSG